MKFQDEILQHEHDQENFLDPEVLKQDKFKISKVVVENTKGDGTRIWKPQKVEFGKPALSILKQRIGTFD